MKKELIVQRDPKSPISEVFRTLRTNIQFMNAKNNLKTVLITSTMPGEGKSWVSSNLAVTFAQAGKKVILVDADMRKGRQYSIFGETPRPGLSNYLSEVGFEEDAADSNGIYNYIRETEIDNLYLIVAGDIPPNPSELLSSSQMIDLLQKLKEEFDVVIVDGTPSQLVTDALILARLVDSTVIVTASKQTKKEDLKKIVNNIKNIGGDISGVIVNKIPISPKKYEQSYYYGSKTIKSNPTNVTNVKKTPSSRKIKNDELPKALKSRIQIENGEKISKEKTNEIFQQINEYMDSKK